MQLDIVSAAIVISGLIFSGVIKGTTGIGYATCALPFLVFAVGLTDAMTVIVLPAMATNIAVAFGNGHFLATWKRFWLLYLLLPPGISAGIWMLVWIEPRIATAVLGATIIAYSVFALTQPTVKMSLVSMRRLQAPIGLVNGFLTGLTGSQVLPLVPYMIATQLPPAQIVQAINIGVLISSATLIGGLTFAGQAKTEMLALSALAIFPALMGAYMGSQLRSRLPHAFFRKLILLVLLVSGLGMLVRSSAL